jgi:HEAT repeat protein
MRIIRKNPPQSPFFKGGSEGVCCFEFVLRQSLPRVAVIVLCLAAACAARPAPEPGPYVVTTDVTHWIRALDSDNLVDTVPAVDGLAALGPVVIPVLEKAFEREPAQVRVGVVEVLSDLGVPETLPLLLRATKDPEPEVRADALDALGGLRDERGREAVEAALGDSDMSVIAAAARACTHLCRSPAAMEALVDRALTGVVRAHQSLVAILRAGNAEQLAAAREVVSSLTPKVMEGDANPELRVRAALLLVEVSPERALPCLRDYAANGSQALLRVQAARALGEAGTERDVETLKGFRELPSAPFLGQVACLALQQMAERKIRGAQEAATGCTPAARISK